VGGKGLDEAGSGIAGKRPALETPALETAVGDQIGKRLGCRDAKCEKQCHRRN